MFYITQDIFIVFMSKFLYSCSKYRLGDIHRKITITLYKEDWIELVTKLKEKLNRIIDNNNKYEWASNIKITHQLCSQKYRKGIMTHRFIVGGRVGPGVSNLQSK